MIDLFLAAFVLWTFAALAVGVLIGKAIHAADMREAPDVIRAEQREWTA